MVLIKVFAVFVAAALASEAPVSESVRGKDLLKKAEVEVASGSKGLVVAFLSARCPCSNSHLPELVELAKAYPDFKFVGVHSNPDEDETQTFEYFKQVKLPFPVLDDRSQELAGRFKALKTPHVFVVQKGGVVAFQGGMSDSKDCSKAGRKFLREALEDMEKGQKVRSPNVRTLGCAIMRKSHVL